MKNNSKKKRILITVLVVAVALIALIVGLTTFITDFLWFRDIGQVEVFFKKLLTQIQIGVPVFIVIAALTFVYLKALRKGYKKRVEVVTETASKKIQTAVLWLLSIATGAVMTYLAISRLWFDWLQFTNSTSFDMTDPIFNNDISFYIFQLSFIRQVNDIVIMGVVAFAIVTFIYYYFLLSVLKPKTIDGEPAEEQETTEEGQYSQGSPFGGGLGNILKMFGLGGQDGQSAQNANLRRSSSTQMTGANLKELLHIASKQITVIGIIFFLMIGVNYFLKQFDLLHSTTGSVFGAGFTDINVTLWVFRIIMVLAVVAAVFFAIGVQKKKVRTMLTIPVIMIVISLLGTGVGTLVQQLVVSPDEINKEEKYLKNNIAYTQSAYGLRDVVINEFPANNNLTSQDIIDNMDSIKNIRINDYDPAKTFYNSTQTIRQYYTFNDVDVDRYMINGEYTQTFISAREIDETKISQQWINKHIKYTHGYGVTLSRVDKVTASGQPDILIKDIPPKSDVAEIEITRPEIYFGESQSNYILVNTKEKEFDYPQGNSNTETTYEGDSGIKMNAFNRLMFSIKERDLQLLVSTNVTKDSKIVVRRNITERVNQIMPYLDYADPYLITVDGHLYWIYEGFTKSNKYPYSEPYALADGVNDNYLRNSVKVVINAYTGDTDYYIIDETDPIAQTFKSIYPKLFKDASEMPEGIRGHVRYPSKMLKAQADIYKKYHVNEYTVFYQGEDRWDIANEKVGAKEQEVAMTPNYYIYKLPGEKEVEFINSIPFTPMNKVNMTALLVARNDGDNYGKLVLYQLPKGNMIMGPSQIDAQIAQDPNISRDFSFWDNAGSTYLRGNMFVIPINDSLMYVEPIYLKASENSLPEVKKIIIYYNNKIAYEATLAEALDSMFGAGTGDQIAIDLSQSGGQMAAPETTPTDPSTPSTPSTPSITGGSTDEMIKQANEAFDNAVAAQKNGDWAKYGQELAKLEEILKKLDPDAVAATQTAPADQTTPQQ